MMFDNTPTPEPSRWQTLKDHIPILLLAGGLLALFIGLHTAATAVLAAAAAHVFLGLALFVGRKLYQRQRGGA